MEGIKGGNEEHISGGIHRKKGLTKIDKVEVED